MEVRGIIIYCDHCGKRLDKPGALIFSPPVSGLVQKFHLCRECYEEFVEGIVTKFAPKKEKLLEDSCKCKCK